MKHVTRITVAKAQDVCAMPPGGDEGSLWGAFFYTLATDPGGCLAAVWLEAKKPA